MKRVKGFAILFCFACLPAAAGFTLGFDLNVYGGYVPAGKWGAETLLPRFSTGWDFGASFHVSGDFFRVFQAGAGAYYQGSILTYTYSGNDALFKKQAAGPEVYLQINIPVLPLAVYGRASTAAWGRVESEDGHDTDIFTRANLGGGLLYTFFSPSDNFKIQAFGEYMRSFGQDAGEKIAEHQINIGLRFYLNTPGDTGSYKNETTAAAAPPLTPSGEDELRRKITAVARKYLGAAYVWGAADPPSAFDCSGFVLQAYKEGAGITLPHSSAAQAAVGREVSRNNIKPGDIIYFNVSGGGISHVALVLDDKNMIHAVDVGKGMAITPLDDPWYKPHIAGYRTLFSGGTLSK
ncbi:MAG: C40 family peptidase [Treponema sp.]|jgi:hypothetical protein|nr:C40 family peptidase [Treponema sp.]